MNKSIGVCSDYFLEKVVDKHENFIFSHMNELFA